MRTFRASLFVVAAIIVSMTQFAQAESGPVTFATVADTPPRLIDPALAEHVTEGMKLTALVQILGPGWTSPRENVGVSRWSFTDGRELDLSPSWGGDWKSEAISFKKRTGVAHVWWLPSSAITIHRGETKEGPRLP